ncbi:hypothetical protein QH494_24740 [Sphingomonas sp. AR_OL41]|uniref:hypothetical protein n=1 Tax=Sphingomonas sp. AR_OL41 TaxID=3042729 RepID=UPI00248167D9|nr:hypothetical protein [Sphingomonas sp. AR_OL41]MDH7975408.1 hypothetical protein [Sphingomonas sp. AR_OL41]
MNISPAPRADGLALEAAAPDLAGLEPIETLKRRWPMVLGAVITLVMIAMLGRQLFESGIAGLVDALPRNPLFYLFFTLYYFSPVVGDYVIFRRLWRIPAAGFAALIRKRIASDMIGYSGEAYFYAWARQRATMVAAPFGAVKDVSILSAISGAAITLTVLLGALPYAIGWLDTGQLRLVIWSAVIIFAMSLPFLVFSKRVFSLDRRTLWWIFAVHCGRVLGGAVLLAITWHFGLPGIAIATWLLLSAARMLVARLPMVPNKDLVFATIAGMLVGQHAKMAQMLALVAGLILIVHAALMLGFALHALWVRVRARR